MPETKRKYDPVKRREYYLRTRELKGRGLTRYTKKGKGSKELRRDEDAKLSAQRELLVMAEKLKQEQAKGNQDSPAYRQLAERYVKTLDNYRKRYTNTYRNLGEGAVDQSLNVARTYRNLGEGAVDQSLNVARTYEHLGRTAAKTASAVATGKVVETNETRSGKLITKVVTKHGSRVFRTVTGL